MRNVITQALGNTTSIRIEITPFAAHYGGSVLTLFGWFKWHD